MTEDLSAALLSALIFAAALLYASVGHAGASGYLAAMALFGLAPETMKPAALVLNILVASIAGLKFYRAGRFSWPLFWPFAVAAVPMAFIGGAWQLPGNTYKILVGLVLCYAAWTLLRPSKQHTEPANTPLSTPLALAFGAAIGLLSGLLGVGGGIFLSPLLLAMGWANIRQSAGVAAPFILLNSIAGLLGYSSSQMADLPAALPYWALAAAVGGWIGAEYGSRRLSTPLLRKLLAVVLVVAGLKLILS